MKRLFIVFIVILLFFVTGCQGITPANTEIIECTESIFHSIDDLANTNAVKGTDIVKASADEPDDFIIPSADHSLTNQEYDKYDGIETQGMHDSNDNRDGTDSEEGQDGSGNLPALPVDNMDDSPEPTKRPHRKADNTDDPGEPSSTDTEVPSDPIPAEPETPAEPVPTEPETPAEPTPTEPETPSELAPTEADSSFEIDSSGTLVNYTGADESVVLPDDAQIQYIGDGAFAGNISITSVNIPAFVTGIGSAAFKGCTSLDTVTFSEGSSINKIGASAFEGCTKLSNIVFTSGIRDI